MPPNLKFQIDDFTQQWTFDTGFFDFVHARCIYGCVADYPGLYKEVLDHLRPGGWYEQAEISVVAHADDGSLAGTTMEKWGPLALQGGEEFGKSFRIAEDMKTLMEASGFVNVTCHSFRWPIGTWAKDPKLKEIGAYNRLGWEDGIEGWAMFTFTKFLGVSPNRSCAQELSADSTIQWRVEEIQVLIAAIRQELRTRSIHAYQYMSVSSM